LPAKVNKKKNKKNEDKKKNIANLDWRIKLKKKNQNFIKGPRTKLYKSKE
jgi:hypothetical protein